MPDDSEIEKTALYYLNKRIDKLEENLINKIDGNFSSLEKTIDAHLLCCQNSRNQFNIRVTRLESFKNRAIGVIAFALFLIGVWKSS